MAKLLTLQYPGTCAGCGAHLLPGDLANWHGRGIVYGLHCHDVNRRDPANPAIDPGVTIRLDRLQGEVIA
jgi:hypothetical protein